jgi:serine protease AprX
MRQREVPRVVPTSRARARAAACGRLRSRRPALVRAVIAATAAALLAPLSALAGPGGGPGGGPPHPRVAPGLAKEAAAHPNANFQVIVQGQPGTSSDGVTAAVGKVRAARNDPPGPAAVHAQLTAISGVAATLSGGDIQALANDPNVTAITPDLPISQTGLAGGPGGPAGRGGPGGRGGYSNDQIWAQDAGVSSLWPLVDSAKLPTIAIVDSGVDPGPIARNLLAQVNLYSGSGQNSKFDGYGHGTMVAGIASLSLAHHSGAAPGANIVSLDVLDDQGMGTESDAIAAAGWILQNKDSYNIKVVNFSLTTGVGTSLLYDPLDQAVEKLWLSGITVVAAAGNYGTSDGPSGVVTAPANDPFVITVGAADTNGTPSPSDDFAAPWSAYGYTPDGFAKPELGAPGRMLNMPVPGTATLLHNFPNRQVSPGYMWMSGTSFAAPIVSGTAADLLALHPSWTPDQVKGALMVSAQRYANGASQFPLGVGIVDGADAATVADPPNPNAALDQFVKTDPTTGLPVFDQTSWTSAAWGSAAWASAAWASAAWAGAAWGSAAWGSAAWASAAWASSSSATAAWGSATWATAVNENANPDG